jgi:hypothetical protein
VTGGSDHKVCIWNLLPVLSSKYERLGNKKKIAEEKRRVEGNNEDEKMNEPDESNNDSSDVSVSNCLKSGWRH